MSSAQIYQMIALEKGLKLELLGMKRSRPPSAYSMIKREFGLTGNRRKVYNEFLTLKNDIMAQSLCVDCE